MPKGVYPGNQNWSEERREKIRKTRLGKSSWNKGIPHTDQTKNKISRSKLKENIGLQAGRARAVKLYPDVVCEICGDKAERHHINENPTDNRRENIRFLCRSHHKKIHENHKKYFEKADLIFALEVAEYLINPIQFLKNIYFCLKPGGKAIISFPLTYPVHNETEKDSLRYAISGIIRLADKANLKVVGVVERRDRTGKLQEFYKADGMKAAKGFDHSVTGYIVTFKK